MERIAQKSSKKEVMGLMEPLISEWFNSKFDDLTEPQSYAIPIIHRRESVLVSSPTGSGKTMTAFLSIINELFKYAKAGKLEEKIYCVYISPLKALANDINRNLEEPLREIAELANKEHANMPKIRVGVRSGDTSQYERQKMLKQPPHILITTPESLALALAAPKFREKFSSVEYVIVDEIHEICDSKRGVFLSLTLERLAQYRQNKLTRIGLSATLAPIEAVAQFLVGHEEGSERNVNIVEVKTKKNLDLKVLCPADDMTTLSYEITNAKMYDMLKDLIDAHQSTIVFTNTRSATEHVVYKLKERGLESIEAHHGSLAKETRLDVEERLKNGHLRCVVSSTSLELGIDIGFVDLVCQIGSPKSVAKGMQRIGRSGHSQGRTAKGRMIVFDTDDLVECAVLCRAAHRSNVDRVTIPENCLDVLAQSIVGMSIEKRWEVEEAYQLVKRSYCYRNLMRESFLEVLRYLGSKEGFEGVYSKIWYDEVEARFGKRKGGRMIYFLNLGTIPEEANYKVVNERGAFVGDLSEKFVERLAIRDVFVLGGKSYEYVRTKGMRIFTKSASGRKPTVPSWTGEMLPRSFDLSMEVARFRRELAAKLDEPEEKVTAWLEKDFDIDNGSARSILSYFKGQMAAVDLIPNDRTLAMEGYIDRAGNHNIIFHFPFGRRVNDALSRAYAFQVTAAYGCNVSVSVVDDAFMLSIPCKIKLGDIQSLLKAEQLDVILRKAVKDSEIFKQRFRHTAARSFMILRNYKGREVSVGRQQVRSSYLLDYLSNLENFPVIKETYREILEDVMDITNAKAVLSSIESGEVAIASIDFSAIPSPFAHNVVLAGISDIVLMEDRSSLLKQLHRKVLSRVMEEELNRFEFEQEVVDTYFRRKRGRAESKEEIVDLLRRTGPLHIFKERGRSIYPYSAQEKSVIDNWSFELLEEGRIASVYADDAYFVASEDLPIYSTIFKREWTLNEADRHVLAALTGPSTVNELVDTLQIDADKVVRSLHVLETNQVVGRSSHRGGKWRYAQREVDIINLEKALDKAISRFIAAFGPVSVEEVAFALGQEEGAVQKVVSALVAEEVLDEGRFLVSEHSQYILKLDHLRLRSAGREVYDNRSIEIYRRSKLNRPFASIEEGLRFFGEVGMQLDLFRRVRTFDMDQWERMRTDGTVLLGRFYRGRVRYIMAEDAPMYISAYRNTGLTSLDQRILGVLSAHDGLSMRGLVTVLGLDKETVKESLDRLDRNAYVVRHYEEGEDWARENTYLPYEVTEYKGDAQLAIVERFVSAYGPIPFYAITTYTGFQPNDVRSALAKLNVEVITVGDIGQEMYLMPDELTKLSAFKPEEEGVKVVSLYDPEVQPMWAEIASRFGDSWVYPIIANGRLVGALEKWNMSGCVDVRSLDLDDPSMLSGVLKALDEVMDYSRLTGLDIVRLREVLGKSTEDIEPEVTKILEESGYFRIGTYFAKGRLIPRVFSKPEVLAYVFKKQRVGGSRKYDNILTAVKRMGSLRSDGEAFIRTRVKVSLKKLHEQGMLIRATSIPEFSTYTTVQKASLYRDAKGVELDQDMRSLLELLAKEGMVSRRRLFDLSPVGEKRTKEAMRKLFLGSCIYLDGANRFRVVPKLEMEQSEARKVVIRNLFENFGLMSAENLSRFMKFELRMRDLRNILANLEDEKVLVKGFLVEGDDAVHWMLAADSEKNTIIPKDEFVLTPMDNLSYLLYPLIRERFGSWQYVVFQGTEMIGAFKGRKKGKDLYVYDVVGSKEVKRIMAEGIRLLNMTIREGQVGGTQEWELQEFYEKTHPGEV